VKGGISTQIDEIIHVPIRLAILAYLSTANSADFMTLLDVTGATKGNLSAHLSKLSDAGYIRIDKEFVGKKPRTSAMLTPDGESAFDSYLRVMKAFVSDASR